jgi:hypothetical protein
MTSRHLLPPLFLGLALGFLIATGPSCGPLVVAPNLCNPATCSGCCSAGKCITKPNNSRVGSCGQNGAACANCGTFACLDFACANADSGNSGGCNSSNCSGCCSGTSASSVCIVAPSATNCGASGAECKSCNPGEACVAGSCSAGDGGAGRVGTACTADFDCAALGPGHLCKKKTSSGANEYQGGYCTRKCMTDPDCPSTALCLGPQPGYGEADSVCWARCTSPTECRTGYDCHAVGGGDSACWLSPLPAFDAGPPADKIGQACGTDGTCRNPPEDGVCLTDKFSDGGSSAFIGGYCSAPCDDSSHCSVDGGAVCIALGNFGACVQSCTTPLQGQGNCRTDYVCRPLRSSVDGGVLPVGFCWPSCKFSGCLMGTCQQSGYCS